MGESDARWEHLTDASRIEMVAGGMLVLVLLFVGIWPMPIMDVINAGVSEIPGILSLPGAGGLGG